MASQRGIQVMVGWAGQSLSVTAAPGRTIVVGRDPKCDVVVPVSTVSRQHLQLQHQFGCWMATDLGSTAGTRRQGMPLRPQEAVRLLHGDQLDLGAGVLAAVEIETEEAPQQVVTATDDAGNVGEVTLIPQASTDSLLVHVLTASRAIGQAASEADIWANAARAMAEATGLGVSSAAVVQVGEDGRTESLSMHGSRSHGWSRRALAAAIAKPGQTAVFERGAGSASERATMMADSQYVACHAPVLSHGGGTLVLCAEGHAALGDGRANFTHFLGIVAELAAQSALQVRRSRISRYVSPSVAAMLVRGGSDTLESDPEWREAACLFLDLQGFSSMVDRDESQLHELHERVRSVMDALARAVFAERGMVVDFTGDGLFAAFGVPASGEGHVGASVRAALAARQVAPASRIGIDAGRCLFGPMGARQHAKLGLFGNVVNRASRMEALGRPERLAGGILCTAAVRNDAAAAQAAQFLRVGMVQPAGLTDAVEVFEVVAPGSVPDPVATQIERWSRELECVRDAEGLAALQAALASQLDLHPRVAWLAARIGQIGADPGAWDGVHRPGK